MPLYSAATSFVPSAEEATERHFFVLSGLDCVRPTEVSLVQEPPELVEVHKLPPFEPSSAATSFVPSAEEATDFHLRPSPTEVSSIH